MGGGGFTYDPDSSKSGDSADNLFKASQDEIRNTSIAHPQRNVFISFDINDENTVNLLRSQAKDDRFPFEFRDYSVKEPFESRWKSRVKVRIAQSSAVIVMIGPNTHESKAVDWEIHEAHRQGKRVIGVRIHRDANHAVPQALYQYNDPVIYWNTKTIGQMLD